MDRACSDAADVCGGGWEITTGRMKWRDERRSTRSGVRLDDGQCGSRSNA